MPPCSTFHLCSGVRGRGAGGDQKARVIGTLPVGALYLGIIDTRLHDPRFEIIKHHPVGDPAEEGVRMAVQAKPRGQGLVEDKLHILIPAIGQHHHKRPGLAQGPVTGALHEPSIAKVHLGIAARLAFHPDRRRRVRGHQPSKKAVDRAEGARIATLATAAR
jgi:hypothetical protein